MAVIETGRVCVKTRGRNTGKKVVVMDVEKGFAVIDGIGFKKKKCNVLHLFPTTQKIHVTKNSTHEHVEKLLKGAKIYV